MERIDGWIMIIMHMKHVRHTLYFVELLQENMPTKESRISVKKTNAKDLWLRYMHYYVYIHMSYTYSH